MEKILDVGFRVALINSLREAGISNEEYTKLVKLCSFGHHKVRQNKLGVCWCARCGLLINSSLTFVTLEEKDKLIIKKHV